MIKGKGYNTNAGFKYNRVWDFYEYKWYNFRKRKYKVLECEKYIYLIYGE